MHFETKVLVLAGGLMLIWTGTMQHAAAQDAPTANAAAAAPDTQSVADQSSASAQPQGNGIATSDSGAVLAEVVVTAEKRTENLQKTPVAVTAVSAAALQSQGIEDLSQLSQLAPELNAGSNSMVVVAIRGVRSGISSPTADAATSTNLDGAYIAAFTGLQGLLFDIDHIEVLDGPQGTLFGRNSVGGNLDIFTNKPKPTFGGSGSIQYGNYDWTVAAGALNLPVTDTLATRVAFQHFSHTGFYANGTDDDLQNSVRAEALWKPTGNDQVLITADDERLGGKSQSVSNITADHLSPGGAATAPTSNVVYPGNPWNNNALYGDADLYRTDEANWGLMLQYDHAFRPATLTFQVQRRYSINNDRTGDVGGWLQTAFNTPNYSFLISSERWDSEELRLTSAAVMPLQWVVGVYRFNETTDDGQNGAWISSTNNTTILNDILNPHSDDIAYAGFGQIVYTPGFLDRLHLTLGGRYNNELKGGNGSTISNRVTIFTSPWVEGHWTSFTYKANLAYDLTPTSMLYGGVSTGFKAGGIGYGQLLLYQPEKIIAYEVGSKNRFLGNRLQLNLDAWIYNYRNIVETIVTPYSLGTQTYNLLSVVNAGQEKNHGVSADLQWLIARDDQAHLTGQWLSNRYGSFDLRQYGLLNYSDTPVGTSPEWSGTFTYDHFFRLPGGSLDLQALVQYSDTQLTAAQAVIGSPQDIWAPSHVVGNLTLTYQPSNANWSIGFYDRNITNALYLTGAGYTSNAAVPYRYNTAIYGAPRTYGFVVNASFGGG